MMFKPIEADGFRGVWYANQKTDSPYHWKYSGGLATYPQQHAPIAIYREDINRTYFVFGGRGERPARADYHPSGGEVSGDTACCVSYFDHETGRLARPVTLVTRDVIDAHENPVICIDPAGHVLMFCPAHGSARPSYIFRTRDAHDISSFECVKTFEPGDNYSYPQPWWIEGQGLVFLHTFYEDGVRRRLGVTRSADGIQWPGWSEKSYLSKIAKGSYQISWPGPDGLIATAFDMHPEPLVEGDHPLNFRTNIYYAQSGDGGRTWRAATGEAIDMPLTEIDNPARVFDGQAEGVLVYLKDIQFDETGNPVLMYLTSKSAWPGPEGGPHRWYVARYDPGAGLWSHHHITTSDHNYDHGSLMLRAADDWRLIAPAEKGPQLYATGGLMSIWGSTDRGATWGHVKAMTGDERFNHTYARRPLDAHDDFAMLWAAADSYHPSETHLYFCNAAGDVFRMPWETREASVAPEIV